LTNFLPKVEPGQHKPDAATTANDREKLNNSEYNKFDTLALSLSCFSLTLNYSFYNIHPVSSTHVVRNWK